MRKLLLLFTAATAVGAIAAAPQNSSSVAKNAVASQESAVLATEEPHHHLILENSRLRAYEVEVAPHEATLLHLHPEDYVYVVLGASDITNATIGRPVVKAQLPDTTFNYVVGPISHIATNNADTPFRNVTIELKRKQGAEKTYYPSVDAALADSARPANPGGSRNILETDELRVAAIKLTPGQVWTPPASSHPRYFLLIDKMKDSASAREPKAPTFPANMLVWVEGGKKWSLTNYMKTDQKVVWLDFKD